MRARRSMGLPPTQEIRGFNGLAPGAPSFTTDAQFSPPNHVSHRCELSGLREESSSHGSDRFSLEPKRYRGNLIEQRRDKP